MKKVKVKVSEILWSLVMLSMALAVYLALR